MNRRLISSIGLLATLAVGLHAQITVVDFGESNSYVTADQNLQSPGTFGNYGFTDSPISPASGYSGPIFWGGALASSQTTGASNFNITNNDANAGGFDAIRVNRGSQPIGETNTMAFVFSASQTFSIDNSSSSFYLNARRQGGQTINGATGLRWILQDTSDNYYISALNTSTAAEYGSNYNSATTGVTQGSLVSLEWFNYNPTSLSGIAGIGTAIADEAAFFSSTEFKSAGFWYTAGRATSSGNIDMRFADFNVVAIPEPASVALLAGVAVLGFVAFRRRRG